jgi:hypothetical protein
MPVFPSREWCEALVDALQRDADAGRASLGWHGDIAAVVLAEPPLLPTSFIAYGRPMAARIEGFRVLEDLDEVEEIEPAYVARAPYSVWRDLIRGTLDPVEAVLRKRVLFQGDLEQVIVRAQFKAMLRRSLDRVPTQFLDGRP